MMTRAPGSSPMISCSAASPSFSGMVMSSVVTSGRSSRERSDGLDAVGRLADDLVAALLQRVRDHLAHERGVVDDEHPCHQAASSEVR